jgi:hypothetical protein
VAPTQPDPFEVASQPAMQRLPAGGVSADSAFVR